MKTVSLLLKFKRKWDSFSLSHKAHITKRLTKERRWQGRNRGVKWNRSMRCDSNIKQERFFYVNFHSVPIFRCSCSFFQWITLHYLEYCNEYLILYRCHINTIRMFLRSLYHWPDLTENDTFNELVAMETNFDATSFVNTKCPSALGVTSAFSGQSQIASDLSKHIFLEIGMVWN